MSLPSEVDVAIIGAGAAGLGAARALERWGDARGWSGPDPYDALNANRLPASARRSRLALRVVTQAVKRSPLDLRPLLGVADGLSAATLAHVVSAYARNGFLPEEEAQAKLRESIRRLASLRCATFSEPVEADEEVETEHGDDA